MTDLDLDFGTNTAECQSYVQLKTSKDILDVSDVAKTLSNELSTDGHQ